MASTDRAPRLLAGPVVNSRGSPTAAELQASTAQGRMGTPAGARSRAPSRHPRQPRHSPCV